MNTESFQNILAKHSIKLDRKQTTTLQINVGLKCDRACRHCHLEAGPQRTEMMDDETLGQVITFARRVRFETIDITGGAPELHPRLGEMIHGLAPLAPRLMVRSNLSALESNHPERLIEIFRANKVSVVASLPSLNPGQTDTQRGQGAYNTSIAALQRLNAAGFGIEGTGLTLDLVANPTGAFMPPDQPQAQKRAREHLQRKYGICFNQLFTFANVPLGRYRRWLQASGNYDNYQRRLVEGFNPCAVDGLMCRTLISVAWDGYLYDCDFNLARGLPLSGRKVHISQMAHVPEPGTLIAMADHCFTCTAGAGFT